MKNKLINCTLSAIVGKNVDGIKAQVRNPIYINSDNPPLFRTMRKIETFKERGKMWVQLHWYGLNDDNCTFTGCTLESDSCTIQISPDELTKMNKS